MVDMGGRRLELHARCKPGYRTTSLTAPRRADLMKGARIRAILLNVSSYFGGEKYLAGRLSSNRAENGFMRCRRRGNARWWKAWRAISARKVQFNAIAPGPVDGDRLSGTGGKPGLFERRGKADP